MPQKYNNLAPLNSQGKEYQITIYLNSMLL